MAGAIAHLVVGERVFHAIPPIGSGEAVYASFLAGCVTTDVHLFAPIPHGTTHFDLRDPFSAPHGGIEPGAAAAECLRQLPSLLSQPFDQLSAAQQAFVAGYVCHLAVDEAWIPFADQLLEMLRHPAPRPIPAHVLLSAYDADAVRLLRERSSITRILREVAFSDVFQHVPPGTFERQWDIVGEYVLSDGGIAAQGRQYRRAVPDELIANVRVAEMVADWATAAAWIERIGGAEPLILTAVDHAFIVVSRLWNARLPKSAHLS